MVQNVIITDYVVPVHLVQGRFIGMDPPKHDRNKALFQRAFTPKAIARDEPEIRDHRRGSTASTGARPATW